jgi:hypothetical protein
MYICQLCNYSTDERGNFSRHKKQKKHLENIDTKKLKNDINKYIAPKFNLDKK